MCIQEDKRLIIEEGKRVNLTTYGKNKKNQVKNKGNISAEPIIKKESKCFSCKKKGHVKKDSIKFNNWLDKKDTQLSFVCYESNMVSINHDTWWIDSGFTIHVSNTLQDMENLRKLDEFMCGNHWDTQFDLKKHIIGFGALTDDLYEIKLQNTTYNSKEVLRGAQIF
ncbi:hypothetical protein CR513_37958, partial [Mucuna pruriens]